MNGQNEGVSQSQPVQLELQGEPPLLEASIKVKERQRARGRKLTRGAKDFADELGKGISVLNQVTKELHGRPLEQVNAFFERFLILAGIGKRRMVGERTRVSYAVRLCSAINHLAANNIRLKNLKDITSKHCYLVLRYLEGSGRSPSTIVNMATVLRRFGIWIGRRDLCPLAHAVVKDPSKAQRVGTATTSKAWQDKGIDPEKVIHTIESLCPVTALQMRLHLQCGLRIQEAFCLKPFQADMGNFLLLTDGTKGGRARKVPINTPEQRGVIEACKAMVKSIWEDRYESGYLTAKRSYGKEQSRTHYQWIMRKAGVTKAGLGVTSHGLRHQYSHNQYLEKTGQRAPVAEGEKVERAIEVEARQQITEALGHGRRRATAAYLGTHRSLERHEQQNLRALQARVQDSVRLTSACRLHGVTTITFFGDVAAGKSMPPGAQIFMAIDSAQPEAALVVQEAASYVLDWVVICVPQSVVQKALSTFEISLCKPLNQESVEGEQS